VLVKTIIPRFKSGTRIVLDNIPIKPPVCETTIFPLTSKDIGKVNIESIRSASGTDSWHDRNGYRSIKANEGFLHHPTHGQIARISHIF